MAELFAGEVLWRPGKHWGDRGETELEVKPEREILPTARVLWTRLLMPTKRSTVRRVPIIEMLVEVTFYKGWRQVRDAASSPIRREQVTSVHQPRVVSFPLDKIDQWQHVPIARMPDVRIFESDLPPLMVVLDTMFANWDESKEIVKYDIKRRH